MESIRSALIYDRTVNQLSYIPVLNSCMGVSRIIVHIIYLAKSIFHLIANLFSSEKERVGSLNQYKEIIFMNLMMDLRGLLRGILEIIPFIGCLGALLYNACFASPAQKVAYKVQEIYAKRLPSDRASQNDSSLRKFVQETKGDWINLPQFERFRSTRMFVDLQQLIRLGRIQEISETELQQANQAKLAELSKKHAQEIEKLGKEKAAAIAKFVNGQAIYFSTDVEKVHKFLQLGEAGTFDDPLFSEDNLVNYAFTAFALGIIDAGDFATTTEIYITQKSFPNCQVHRIFNNGDLTVAGEKFVQAIEDSHHFGMGLDTNDFRKEFIEAIRPLKPYQQAFWTHDPLFTSQEMHALKQHAPLAMLEMLYAPVGSLSAALAMLGVVYEMDGQQVAMGVHVHRALINKKYGTTSEPYVPKLGSFKPTEIVEGIKQEHRLGATYGAEGSFLNNIHNSLEPPSTIIQHDRVHAKLLHQYGPEFVGVILQMVNAIETTTQIKMSKDIWVTAEATVPGKITIEVNGSKRVDLRLFMHDRSGRLDEPQLEEIFWHPFEKLPKPQLFGWNGLFTEAVATPALWSIFLDMYRNQENYTQYQHDLKYTFEWKLMEYAFENGIIAHGDNPKIKVWTLQQLRTGKSLAAVRQELAQITPDHLEFVKLGKADQCHPRRMNTIVLRMKGSSS